MNEIRIQKINGVEFVTYKDYLKLKEEKEKKADLELLNLTIESREFKIKTLIEETDYLRGEVKKLEEENEKLKSDLEQFSEAYKRYRDYEKEELAESCYDLARENKKLEDEVKDLVERNIELDKKYMIVLTENKNLEEEINEWVNGAVNSLRETPELLNNKQ